MDDNISFDYHPLWTRKGQFFVCEIPTLKPNQGSFATQKVYLRMEKDGSPSLRRVASRNRSLSVRLVEWEQNFAEGYDRVYGFTRMFAVA